MNTREAEISSQKNRLPNNRMQNAVQDSIIPPSRQTK
jgi:hypothetical protein